MALNVRRSHIKRLFGRDAPSSAGGDATDNKDVWVDVLRIDEFAVLDDRQRLVYTLRWMDGPDDPPGGNPARLTAQKKIVGPDDDPVNPQTYVPIDVIKKFVMSDQSILNQLLVQSFVNDALKNTARNITIKRVVHWDTNIDPSDNPSGADYRRKPDTRDPDQYVDFAVINKNVMKDQAQAPEGQVSVATYNNAWLKDALEDRPNDATRAPIWLDPFQFIINCQFGGATEFIVDPTSELMANIKSPISVADSKKITISLGFYLDAHDGAPDGAGGRLFIITPINSSSGYPTNIPYTLQIGVTIYPADPLQSNIQVDLGTPPHQSLYTNFGEQSPMHFGLGGRAFPGAALKVNQWNKLVIAFDGTENSVFDLDALFVSGPTMVIAVNGVAYDPFEFGAGHTPGSTGTGPFQNPPFQARADAGFDENVGGNPAIFIDEDGNFAFPGAFNIGLDGLNLCMPGLTTDFGTVGQDFALAAVQMWTDQFIDPRTQMSKFMRPGPDGSTLFVDQQVAADAYGKPQLWFDGPPGAFAKNKGTATINFTKTGEVKSFSPRPKTVRG